MRALRRPAAAIAVCVALSLAIGVLLSSDASTRFAVVVVLAIGTTALAIRAPSLVILLMALWLVVLGTLRRLTTGLVGAGASVDPLLAVEPLAFAVLTILAVRSGALRHRSSLTKAALALAGILTLSALNPLQGSPRIGLTGAVVVVAPMLAFLVGRTFLTDSAFGRLLAVVAGLAVPAAAYGLYQVFSHFPSWDQNWIEQNKSFLALNVGGSVRPFGSFASGQEFALYVAMGLVVLAAFGRRSRWIWILPLLAILSAAVWYESSRTVVVFVAFALVLAATTRLKWSLGRSIFAAFVVLATLPWIVGHVVPARFGQDTGGRLQSHQAAGLADPFGNQSTLPFHITLVSNGLKQAVTNPLGRGVGSVTGAAGKFGRSSAGTEVDVGNVAVAGGILGLVTYLAVALLGLTYASRRAVARRDALSVAALSLLAVTFLQWLNGGLYAIGWLPWLVLGWVDRPGRDAQPEADAQPVLIARTVGGPGS